MTVEQIKETTKYSLTPNTRVKCGATIILSKESKFNNGSKETVLLCVKDNGEFVTWMTYDDYDDSDGNVYYGHYFYLLEEALDDFRNRN